MIFRITEQLLLEDIESVRNRYKGINDETFNAVLESDPTYRQGSNSVGTYTKWCLDMIQKGKMSIDEFGYVSDETKPNGELYDEGTGESVTTPTLINVLTEFNSKRKYLEKKDIGQYKSLSDVYFTALHCNPEERMTQRQKERELRRAYKDAQLVYEDSDWYVYIPQTYEASCTLGKGTDWCTATSKTRDYYDRYTSDGPLYIIINKNNPDEKYQYHVQSHQFMNKEDNSVNRKKFFSDNKGLSEFFFNLSYQLIGRDDRFTLVKSKVINDALILTDSKFNMSVKITQSRDDIDFNGDLVPFKQYTELLDNDDIDSCITFLTQFSDIVFECDPKFISSLSFNYYFVDGDSLTMNRDEVEIHLMTRDILEKYIYFVNILDSAEKSFWISDNDDNIIGKVKLPTHTNHEVNYETIDKIKQSIRDFLDTFDDDEEELNDMYLKNHISSYLKTTYTDKLFVGEIYSIVVDGEEQLSLDNHRSKYCWIYVGDGIFVSEGRTKRRTVEESEQILKSHYLYRG